MSTSPPPTLQDAGRPATATASSRRTPWYRNPRYLVSLLAAVAVVAAVLGLVLRDDSPGSSQTPEVPPGPYVAAYGTFEPVEASGTGAGEVALPAGATAGIIDARADGPGRFEVGFVHGSSETALISGARTPYAGSVPYGLDEFTPGALQVRADGPWTLTISPIAAAEELPAAATGTGDAVFVYEGASAEWAVEVQGRGGFAIRQWRVGTSTGLTLALGEGSFEGPVQSLTGPSVVAVHADGPWSITAG